jgi:hypothetical protein
MKSFSRKGNCGVYFLKDFSQGFARLKAQERNRQVRKRSFTSKR